MKITERRNDNATMLVIWGRIDTLTSPKLQQAVLNAFQKSKDVVLDFEEVEYISSAGLRVLLIGYKAARSKNGSLKLTKVKPAVMEVLTMTGFQEILGL
jgi:anti-anti-sigma factor